MSKILVSGGLVPTTKDTLLDARTRVATFSEIANIENPARFMVIAVEETGKKYEVRKLSSKIIGGIVVENSTIDINDPEALVDLGLAEELRSEDEKVRQSNESKRIEAENLRKAAEDSRKVNETNRVSAEGVRESSERIRVSSEETRNANEQTRNSNETKRQSQESTRQSQESARQTNESTRNTNESSRKEAESKRKTEETSRRTAELSRSTAENERAKNEQNRTTAENTRSSAEDRRVTNETQRTTNETARSNAELSREQAEGNRASTFNTLKGQMQTTIQEGQTAVAATEKATSDAQKVVDEYDTKVAEQDSKLTELGSKFSIYDLSATGGNVSKFTGIKDLVIKNPKDGLVYTVTSISKSSDSAKINIYSSIDNVGTSYALIASFETLNPQSSEREYFHVIGKNKEKIFAAIVWSEIPEGSFSQMWNNEYPLSNKVFQYGVSSDFAIMKMIEEGETELLNDKVPSSVKNIFYNELNLGSYVSGDTRIKDGGIIECYLHESVTSNEGDIVVSTMLNTNGKCNVTIVNGGTVLGQSTIESTSLQYPILLHILERNEIVAGYMLVDWSKISNFQGVGTGVLNKKRCSIFHGSSSCLFEYIKNNFTSKEDYNNVLELISENVIELAAGGINYLTGANIKADNTYRTDYVSVAHDIELSIKGNEYYKDFYVIKYLDKNYVGYEKNKKEITANPTEFNQIRVRIDYTSENDVDTLLRTSVVVRRQDGVLYKSDKKYLEKDNLVFKEDYVPLPNVGMLDLSTGRYSSGSLNFVTSDYISVFPNQKMSVLFGGYGNAGIAGFSDKQGNGFTPVYKNSSTSPLKETEVVNIVIPNGVYYIRITSYKSLVDYSSISYDKSINIDLLKNLFNRENISPTDIWNGYVTLRLLNVLSNGSICDFSAHRLNFNIPNDDDKIFISTDIYNTKYRDNPTEQDLVKAFAPMLFYKRKKVGCFVLFDTENNNRPFIYDANGNKKYLTLTDE